jgi:radical SAM protein with 4Fe4S-binding SPASM domain
MGLLQRFYGERRLILSAHLDLTLRCNFRCVHCEQPHTPGSAPELSTDELREALDQLASLHVLRLTVSGGEAFLRRDLLAILEHARQRHFAIRLKTNGSLLTPARARALARLGVLHVDVTVFSLDPGVNDAITGVAGSLEKVLRGLHTGRDAGLVMSVKMPVLTSSAATAVDSARTLEAMGFRVDAGTRLVGDGPCSPVWGLQVDSPTARALMAEMRRGRPAVGVPRAEGDWCEAGRTAIHVDPFGNVRACAFLHESFGNLREQPMETILASEARQRFARHQRKDVRGCSGCLLLPYCMYCPAISDGMSGDPWHRDARHCHEAATHCRLAGGRRVGREYVFPAAPAKAGEER